MVIYLTMVIEVTTIIGSAGVFAMETQESESFEEAEETENENVEGGTA